MAYTVPHNWVAGDFLRASWLQITTTDLIDHETRVAVLEAAKVTGQSVSVDSEIALFSSTTGKALKRATTTGVLKATSGVIAAASAGTDYVSPTGAETLTNKTLTAPHLISTLSLNAARVQLTDAQIKALPTTGITIVAAPGAGKAIMPVYGTIFTKTTSGAYTNIDAASSLNVGVGSTALLLSMIPNDVAITNGTSARLSGLLGGTNTLCVPLIPYLDTEDVGHWGPVPPVYIDSANVANAALAIYADNGGSGNFTGGNAANTLTVFVVYAIVDVP